MDFDNISKFDNILKCTNPNGETVLVSKLNHVELFFTKIVRITFKNESYKLFSKEKAQIAPKTRLSIIFS